MEVWLILLGGGVSSLILLYWWVRWLAKREPYRTFLRLPVRQKFALFRAIIADRRVPRWVKAAPFLLAGYLVFPIDLIPDFIPVLGYLDDVALLLIVLLLVVRFTPPGVISDLLAKFSDVTPTSAAEPPRRPES